MPTVVLTASGIQRRFGRVVANGLSRRTQIDFVAVSSGVSGQVRPKTFEEKIFRRSDHRPLVGTLHFNVAVAFPKTAARPSRPSLAGWLPNDGQ